MKLFKNVGVFALVGVLAACGSSNPPTDTGPGTDGGTDVQRQDVRADTQTPTDTATGNYGICGMAFFTCICACNQGDQACVDACFQRAPMSCQTCVGGAQAMCCPTEDANLTTCADNAQNPSDGAAACTTQACLEAACASQLTAYNTCLQNATTCDTYFARCFGDLTMACP